MSWRDDSPTEKQLHLISQMECFFDSFKGTTKGEASDYISKNMEEYKQALMYEDEDLYYMLPEIY